jgi:GNAT acetyltransferase-like protein
MIRIDGRGAKYGDVWFDEEPAADCGVDIVRYRRRSAPIARARCAPLLSMVTDLAAGAEAIAAAFGKDCRYKIRRAESKDELAAEFILDPAGRLDEFRAFFDTFARQKGHEPSDAQWLRAACDARQLVLTTAARHGEALVWHAYLVAGKSAWLQYTGSCFRDRENDYRALVGRANRWLHWKDMLQFKERGLTRYDWGGMFEDESAPDRAGINEFKRSFGGQAERSYDCTVPLTLRGRVYLPLREAWRKRRAIPSG